MDQPSSMHYPLYTDDMSFLPAVCAPQGAVRLLSAHDMYDACDVFLSLTTSHSETRWIPAKGCRNELARRFRWSIGATWQQREEWKATVQLALKNVRQQQENSHIHELDEWDSWVSLETDIHKAAFATRKTVEFFYKGDEKYLPMSTDLFVVPNSFDEFLGTILSGDVMPAWISKVDAEKTPGCRNGLHPKYRHR